MTQVNQLAFHHSVLQKPQIDIDERVVAALVELLENWTNQFEGSQCIVSISSANVAPKDVTHDLLRAHSIGEEAYDSFSNVKGLKKRHRRNSSMIPWEKTRLKTFTTIERNKHVHISGNAAIWKADRSLFGRMIVIAQSRQLNMRAIFVHPRGPITWALATPEGLKTSKTVLAHHLQKGAALA